MKTIDEICDAIDSSELITFKSMSEAFDNETSSVDSCDPNTYMPSQSELINATRDAAVEAAHFNSIGVPGYIEAGDVSRFVQADIDWMGQHVDKLQSKVKTFIESSIRGLFSEFVVNCLKDERDCVPPDTSGGWERFIPMKKVTDGNDSVRGRWIYFDCAYLFKEGKFYLKYFIGLADCSQNPCETNLKLNRMLYRYKGSDLSDPGDPDAVKSLNFTKDGTNNFYDVMKNGVETKIGTAVKGPIEECYRNECGLDNKVRS